MANHKETILDHYLYSPLFWKGKTLIQCPQPIQTKYITDNSFFFM